MTIFDYIKDIVVTKRGDLPLEEYTPFLVNRWLSFINPEVCQAISFFNNKALLEDKQMHYKTMLCSFPKMKYSPRISYIKKANDSSKNEEDFKIKILAENLEISTREVKELFS